MHCSSHSLDFYDSVGGAYEGPFRNNVPPGSLGERASSYAGGVAPTSRHHAPQPQLVLERHVAVYLGVFPYRFHRRLDPVALIHCLFMGVCRTKAKSERFLRQDELAF